MRLIVTMTDDNDSIQKYDDNDDENKDDDERQSK